MNNRDGTFREEGLLRGVGLNDDGSEQAGMGVGIGDYDLSGRSCDRDKIRCASVSLSRYAEPYG